MTDTKATSGLMQGKRGLILGVANKRSIAYGIARSICGSGGEVALTYQGEALKQRVVPIAEELGAQCLGHLDVLDPATIDAVFSKLEAMWGRIDFLVHSLAFSDREELTGRYLDTSAENFSKTMLISVHSLTEVLRRGEHLLKDGASVLTLTYYGSQKVIPHYNVMGVAKAALEASVRYLAVDLGSRSVRVNAISAGPIKTLAASGISHLRTMLTWSEENAPLGRLVTIDDVGASALGLLSDLGRGTTGEVVHVDCGYNILGMKRLGSVVDTS